MHVAPARPRHGSRFSEWGHGRLLESHVCVLHDPSQILCKSWRKFGVSSPPTSIWGPNSGLSSSSRLTAPPTEGKSGDNGRAWRLFLQGFTSSGTDKEAQVEDLSNGPVSPSTGGIGRSCGPGSIGSRVRSIHCLEVPASLGKAALAGPI